MATSPPSKPVAHARARLAVAVRDGRDPDQLAALRRDLLGAKVADQLTAWVNSLPAPTPEQIREIAAILSGR
jgi:hypothetical protein